MSALSDILQPLKADHGDEKLNHLCRELHAQMTNFDFQAAAASAQGAIEQLRGKADGAS